MGFSFIGFGVSVALLVIAGALVYYYCFRKKKSPSRPIPGTTHQDNLIGGGSGNLPTQQPAQPYPPPASAPIGWNLKQASAAPGGAPYPTSGPGTAPYPTTDPLSAPYPTGGLAYGSGGSTVRASGLSETNPSAPPPPYSSPPPYPT